MYFQFSNYEINKFDIYVYKKKCILTIFVYQVNILAVCQIKHSLAIFFTMLLAKNQAV